MGTSIQHLTLSRMEPFKHSCSVLLLLALIIFVAGIEEGDVDGSLGYGRTFRGLPGLNYLDNVQNVEPEECCGACKKKAPDTEVIDFQRMTSSRDGEMKYCTCKKRDVAGGRVATQPVGTWSGKCGNMDVEVDGGVGPNTGFIYNYVNVLGKVDGAVGECCEKCVGAFPTTQLSEQYEDNKCVCFDAIPGTTPMTASDENYAGICGE